MVHDDYAGLKGRFYRGYIRRPAVGRLVGAALWGSDFRPLYRSLESLASLPERTTVLDAACGAGLALEWLDPRRRHSYVGIDLSPSMLARARAVASERGFDHVDLRLGDITAIPLADGAADVALCFNALHCVAEPQTVVDELARCLAAGGLALGTSLVWAGSSRADRLLRLDATMGPGGTLADLDSWLRNAGLRNIEVEASGAMATFRAHR